jgi:hypothetical protein
MEIVVVGAAISQSVNQPWIAVIGKNNWLVAGE